MADNTSKKDANRLRNMARQLDSMTSSCYTKMAEDALTEAVKLLVKEAAKLEKRAQHECQYRM